MTTRTSFFVRPLRILSILFCAICLVSAAEAQHGGGGGGGHGGGGHSGGGHSGHSSGGHASSVHSGASHTGSHFGWLHVFGRHSGGKSGTVVESSTDLSSRLWNFNTLQSASARRLPATMIWSPPHVRPGADNRFFGFRPIRHHPGFFFPRFGRFPSGCFFNGVTQACFFEPFWPLCFGGTSGLHYSSFGFGGTADVGDESGPTSVDISAMSAAGNPLEDNTLGNSTEAQAGSAAAAQDGDLGKGVYVLMLNDGTSRIVTDYWEADGYLEYVSRDESRSHIPLAAVDLQATVSRNAARGLGFVLRSEPGQER